MQAPLQMAQAALDWLTAWAFELPPQDPWQQRRPFTGQGWAAIRMPDGRPLYCWSAGLYQGELQALIRQAKYGGSWTAHQLLVRSAHRISASAIWQAKPLLLPLPPDPRRLPGRGAHLPLLFALRAAQVKGCSVDRLALFKPRSRPTQAGQSREARLALSQDSLQVNPAHLDRLRRQPVVLVDDVSTTGATLGLARAQLESWGVAVLGGLVLARAPLGRHGPGR